jgi:hypothetical protein
MYIFMAKQSRDDSSIATGEGGFDPVEAMRDLLGLDSLDRADLEAYAWSVETNLNDWTSQMVIDHSDRFAASRGVALSTVEPQSLDPAAVSDAASEAERFDPEALLDELRAGRDAYIDQYEARARAIVEETPAILNRRLNASIGAYNFREAGRKLAAYIFGEASTS